MIRVRNTTFAGLCMLALLPALPVTAEAQGYLSRDPNVQVDLGVLDRYAAPSTVPGQYLQNRAPAGPSLSVQFPPTAPPSSRLTGPLANSPLPALQVRRPAQRPVERPVERMAAAPTPPAPAAPRAAERAPEAVMPPPPAAPVAPVTQEPERMAAAPPPAPEPEPAATPEPAPMPEPMAGPKPETAVAPSAPATPAPAAPSTNETRMAATPPAAPAPARPAADEPSAPLAPMPTGSSTRPASEPSQLAARPPANSAGGPVRVTFESESAKLPDSARNDLAGLAAALKSDDALRIQLLAYAEGTSETASQARRLSLSRALAVRSYLIEQGVRSTRMDVRALGDKAENGPADRVDVVIVER